MISRRRGWWLALLLTLLPAPVASQGDSAVVQVVRVIDGDTVQALLAAGADVHAKTKKGHTTLMVAAITGHADIGQMLIEAGARE